MHDHAHQLTLGLAFGLGALHALEPGHGKTAMLIYLAGERRSLLHPLVMGLSSALAHSVSLIAIAAAVHLTHHLVVGDHHHNDEAVTAAMQWISAGLVVCVGIWMVVAARSAKPATCGCSGHQHDCDQPKKLGSRTSYSMSALLGIAFGLLPCPSAMAAYFTGMSAGTPVRRLCCDRLIRGGYRLFDHAVRNLGSSFWDPIVSSAIRPSRNFPGPTFAPV